MIPPQKTACIQIGGIPIGLSTADDRFFALLRERYEGFLSSALPEFGLEFELIDKRTASDADVHVRRDGNDWLIERGDFRACLNLETKCGIVRQTVNPYSLDSVIRILHSLILAKRGGFLLHAASGICEGTAYLFSGVSGAGKTTMTRLAPPDITLLTDEISYIRPSKDGYAAFGTPFAGELAKPGENCSAPIGALFFLEKGSSNLLEELVPAEAVRRLMRNILFFAEDKFLVDTLMATACEFVERVPIRRLTFYPDGRVWDEIRQFQGVPEHA
jgi:hypothetical protein